MAAEKFVVSLMPPLTKRREVICLALNIRRPWVMLDQSILSLTFPPFKKSVQGKIGNYIINHG
jgi:hypothetical protein